MKPGKFTHAIAVLLSSIASLFAHGTASKAEPAKTKFSKNSEKTADDRVLDVSSLAFTPGQLASERLQPGQRYPWKSNIVTTIFWIGEKPSGNNPVPNRTSSWDKEWTKNYGGMDDPDPAHRSNYIPVNFTPGLNPFYCALPYNDKAREGHRPEAPRVVPWFRKRIRARPFPLAKADGSPSAKAIASRMRSGKMQDHSAPITGSTFSVTNGQSLISTKALASMFRLPCAITSD